MERELKAAKYYLSLGLNVIPLVKSESKRPALESWKKYQEQYAGEEDLESWFSKNNYMVGIVTGKISNLIVIDIDTPMGEEEIYRALGKDFKAPMVHTANGGKHLYCNYSSDVRNRASFIFGVDLRGEGGYVVAPPSTLPNGKAWKWDAKNSLHTKRPDFPSRLLEKYEVTQTYVPENDSANQLMFIEGRRDEDLFHVANYLVRGGMDVRDINIIINHLANACNPPFSKTEATIKVKSAIERALRRERNFVAEIKEWIGLQKGIFLASELAKALHFYGPDDMKGMSKALNSLVEARFIDRVGQRAGVYRKIESSRNLMDWKNAVINPMQVYYPLGLHEYFNTHAKSIIVIAGVKDAGKTAFMLDFIKNNMDKFKIHYFTNELSEEELKVRILKHADLPIEQWNFEAYFLAEDWQDAISPDDINIIDYLEPNSGAQSFASVGDIITAIHTKLNKGIALISIQKHWKQELGVGGQFSIHKARMYITLDKGKAKVMSMKNKVPGSKSIEGQTKQYVLEDGWKFHSIGHWHYEQEKK